MNIVITDGYTLNPGDLHWSAIEVFGKIKYYDTSAKEVVTERCKDAEIIVVNKTLINAETIRAAKNLKLIAVTATGYNNVDTETAKEVGVTVCNVPEYGTFSVAQHTFALILELVNHVGLHAQSVKNGEWTGAGRWCYAKKPITELKDKTLGIIGFGKIGEQVGVLGRAFGMNVIFHNRSPKTSAIARQVDMEEIFSSSDVLSLHCPLTKENEGFVNGKLLSMMKRSALLINASRGQLINENDLAEALKNRVISAAALDVLSSEPPPLDHPLIHLDNCLITPHNAWVSFEARSRIMKMTAGNIGAFLKGSAQNVVDK
jgi:glycerate dehydrogenase